MCRVHASAGCGLRYRIIDTVFIVESIRHDPAHCFYRLSARVNLREAVAKLDYGPKIMRLIQDGEPPSSSTAKGAVSVLEKGPA
jgi:hypothetical protein